jgi:hypothetical protein
MGYLESARYLAHHGGKNALLKNGNPPHKNVLPQASSLEKGRKLNYTPLTLPSEPERKEKKELLNPSPGTLFVGKEDLVGEPSNKDIILHTNGTVKFTVRLDEQWRDVFARIKSRELHGGIHLRSNAAQAQFDITNWEFSKEPEHKQDMIIVTLKNLSPHTASIPSGTAFKLGNPYCYKSPLEGEELEKVAKKIMYLSKENAKRPLLLRKEEREKAHFVGDTPENKQFDALILPLTAAHLNKTLHSGFDLSKLPSGPHRGPLHGKIHIDSQGRLIGNMHLSSAQHIPLIQLTSPPLFSMPPGTALISESCIKTVGKINFLVPFSASKGHFPVAVAKGTGNEEGHEYQHRFIAESLNTNEYPYREIYPTALICRAFNVVTI